MPAGFNKGQVEYIKAVTNSHSHKTYKDIKWPVTKDYNFNSLDQTHDTVARYKLFCLTRMPRVRDTAGTVGTWPVGTAEELNALNVAITDNATEDGVALHQRIGSDFYLKSTHLRLRCMQTHSAEGDFVSDHNEYRMIVFRSREVQSSNDQLAQNHSNPFFDLFHGIANYKVGISGYQKKMDPQGNLDYVFNSATNLHNSHWADEQGCLTLPVNKESYVVMKDVRFFLGRDYGGKNIFETTLHWDWEDPISTVQDEVDQFDNNKNYCWYVWIFGNSNSGSGGPTPNLNVSIQGTTHGTSD